MGGKWESAARAHVPPFEVMRILKRVEELRAGGRDVISLCAGEPSGGAPAAVQARAAELHSSANEFTYTPSLGISQLREAIAGHYKNWYDIDVDPAAVAVTTGSSGAFVLAFLAAFNPGDRVVLTRPGYPAYRNLLRTLGIDVVEIDCGPETDFQPTVAALAEVHEQGPIRGIVLASPANPTGTMISEARLRELVAWCHARGVRIVSDEIYHGITYTSGDHPRGVCVANLDPHAIIVSSFSKYWGMTGWRIGWMIMPEELRSAIDALAGNVALSPPSPAQGAVLAAFSPEAYDEADARVAELARVRQIALDGAPRLGWGPIAPADGAFYLYGAVPLGDYEDSSAWAAALLEEAGVALVPGSDFDGANGGNFVRLSFAAGAEAVAGALERIEAFSRR